MRTKLLISLAFLLISPLIYAQDFITLPGAGNVERRDLSEEELRPLLGVLSENQNERLDAIDVEIAVVSSFFALLTYEQDLAKDQFGLSDVEISKLLERIDIARSVHREINTRSKYLMCEQWRNSARSGDDRTNESIQNYDYASESRKGEAGDAYLAAISDIQNLVGQEKSLKISEYLNSVRTSFAATGQMSTLSDTIRKSSDSNKYLTDICGGQQ